MSPLPLPILTPPAPPTDPLRAWLRTDLLWSRHLGDDATLDIGTAFAEPSLADTPAANHIRDAAIPPGMSAADALAAADAHFAARGSACLAWLPQSAGPLTTTLAERGFTPSPWTIHRLETALAPLPIPPGLKLLPARAARSAYVALCPHPADLLHLDDPTADGLLLLEGRSPVGVIFLQPSGQIAALRALYIAPPHRGRGLARLLISRAVDAAARGDARTVLAAAPAPADRIYATTGFTPVATLTWWLRPLRNP